MSQVQAERHNPSLKVELVGCDARLWEDRFGLHKRAEIQIRITASEAGFILSFQKKESLLPADDTFPLKVAVELKSEKTPLSLSTVDPQGELFEENYEIFTPRWEELLEYAQAHPDRPWEFRAGVGVSENIADDPRIKQLIPGTLSSNEVTPGFTVGFRMPDLRKGFYLDTSVDYYATPFQSAGFSGTNIRTHYLSGEINQVIPIPNFFFFQKNHFAVGAYFGTMSTGGLALGYRRLIGPQLKFETSPFSGRLQPLLLGIGVSTFSVQNHVFNLGTNRHYELGLSWLLGSLLQNRESSSKIRLKVEDSQIADQFLTTRSRNFCALWEAALSWGGGY